MGTARRGSQMGWYGVRMLFKSSVVGRPRRRDAGYRPGLAALEDRVIVVEAHSGIAAIAKAERMARQYVAGKTVNCYGQRVVVASLGVASAYEMDERPRDGAEIYSHIQFISVRDSRKALLRPWKEFGRSDTAFARRFAWMFIEGQIKSGFDEWVARRRPRAAGAKRREQSR